MWEYLDRLTNDNLIEYVRYAGDKGEKRERLLWHCLLHVINHGTHHRSQAVSILKGHGCLPVALDLTAFLNEQRWSFNELLSSL